MGLVVTIFRICSNMLALKCVMFDISRGPEGFTKVREAERIHFHLISCESDLMVPSYDQKTRNNFTPS